MKNRLPALTAVVLLAGGGYAGYRSYHSGHSEWDSQQQAAFAPSAPAVDPKSTNQRPRSPTAGDKLLVQAITQMERRPSVTARMRHVVAFGGRQLKGTGSYWQQANGDELRVRLELQVFSNETSLLQVSNGRFLWTDRHLPIGRSITRIDLRQLRNEVARESAELDDIEPGQASWLPIQPDQALSFGGLPTLLSSLAEHFTFLPPQAMRWTPATPLDRMPETFPVFAIVGHWNEESLQTIVPAQASGGAKLPERLPQEILILFGQADLFPYRIEFRKLLNPPSAKDAPHELTPYQLCGEPLVLLELEDVSFDAAIAAGQFDFSPGDAEWDDHTAEYLDKIRHKRQEQLAARSQVDQGPDQSYK